MDSSAKDAKVLFDRHYMGSEQIQKSLILARDALQKKNYADAQMYLEKSEKDLQILTSTIHPMAMDLYAKCLERQTLLESRKEQQERIEKLEEENKQLRNELIDVKQNDNIVKGFLEILLKKEETNKLQRNWLAGGMGTIAFFVLVYLAFLVGGDWAYPRENVLTISWAWIAYILKISGCVTIFIVIMVTLARFLSNKSVTIAEINDLLREIKASQKEFKDTVQREK